MEEVHYCVACMHKSVLDQDEHLNCPNCDMHNFMLFRAGQFGTAIFFEQNAMDSEDFEWCEGHYREYCKKDPVSVIEPSASGQAMDSIASRLRRKLAGDETGDLT